MVVVRMPYQYCTNCTSAYNWHKMTDDLGSAGTSGNASSVNASASAAFKVR